MPRPHDVPRVLTTDTARALGISRSAIRHGIAAFGWDPLLRGVVLTAPGVPTRDDWILVGLAAAGSRAAVSGWDAIRMRGGGGPAPPNGTVLVLDRDGSHRRLGGPNLSLRDGPWPGSAGEGERTASGVVIRPTSRAYRTSLLPAEHPSLAFAPIVHPERALADAALMHRTFPPVRAMVTSAVQRGICNPDTLLAELEASPRQGSRWLRRAMADVVAGAKSVAEADAIDHLTRARVPTFEVNVPILDRDGIVIAEADVLWRHLRMILEIDSRQFHFSADDWAATMRRHTKLTRLGFAVEHHPPSAFRDDGRAWAASVAQGVRARSQELGLPYVPGNGPQPVPVGGHPPMRTR